MFINEYMVNAPGDYVKVFLYGLMHADLAMSLENDMIAKELAMEDEDVLKAWSYWEKQGVIRKYFPDPSDKFHYQVEFIDLKEQLYGAKTAQKGVSRKKESSLAPGNQQSSEAIRAMYAQVEQVTGRLLEANELLGLQNWLTDYSIGPDVVVFVYTYCKNRRDGKTQYQYVNTVLRDWVDRGLKSVGDIERYLTEADSRHYQYKRVMKALGFSRGATEHEREIMDAWFDDFAFGLETVLEACKKTSGISNPNINYVNSVLTGKKGDERKGAASNASQLGSAAESGDKIRRVMRSYEEDREQNEQLWKQRTAEIYEKIPQIESVDTELRQLSMELPRLILSGRADAKKKAKEIQQRMKELNVEKAYLLTENDYAVDYMELPYTCAKCKDTGMLDNGERCSCFGQKLARL